MNFAFVFIPIIFFILHVYFIFHSNSHWGHTLGLCWPENNGQRVEWVCGYRFMSIIWAKCADICTHDEVRIRFGWLTKVLIQSLWKTRSAKSVISVKSLIWGSILRLLSPSWPVWFWLEQHLEQHTNLDRAIGGSGYKSLASMAVWAAVILTEQHAIVSLKPVQILTWLWMRHL